MSGTPLHPLMWALISFSIGITILYLTSNERQWKSASLRAFLIALWLTIAAAFTYFYL